MLRGAFNNPANYHCVGGKLVEDEQQSSKVWREWSPHSSTIQIELNDDVAKTHLNQPWIAEMDTVVTVESAELGIRETADLNVVSNDYRGSGVFRLCEGDSVAIGGSVFQATDFSEGGVTLTEKGSGKSVMLVSKDPETTLYSVRMRLVESKRISGKSTNPFQSKVDFSLEGEPGRASAMPSPETLNPTAKPGEKNLVAGTEIRCKKTVIVPYRLVFPFASPCPNGFAAERIENFGNVVFFYRRAVCVKEYSVCAEKPVCDPGDETVNSNSCVYEALPASKTGK